MSAAVTAPGALPDPVGSTAAPGRRSRTPGWATVLLVVGLAVQLAPLLLLGHVLTQDGPAHVDSAWVLLHHGDPGVVGDALREHYLLDLSPVPNLLTTGLLAALLPLLGPDWAEKAVVAGFVLALVLGLRYALRGVDRRAGWLAVAALPFAGSHLVAYGFYNFVWGVALSLIAMGVALRAREGWTAARTVALALLLLLTWSAHLMPEVAAVGVVGALAVGRLLASRREAGWGPALRRHVAGPALAVAPTVLLTGWYVVTGGGDHGEVVGGPSLVRVGWLLSMYRPLVVGSWWELPSALLVAGTLLALLVVAVRRRGAPADGGTTDAALARSDRAVLGLSTVLAALAVLVVPSRLGQEYGFLPDRLAWFPPLVLLLFCATRLPRRTTTHRLVAGLLVLAATVAALVRLPTQLADERAADELLSVAADIPAGSTFLVLRFDGHEAALAPLPRAPDPLRHVSSRLAIEAGAVDVGHYEAAFPYFQVRFTAEPGIRAAIDPEREGIERVPPTVDLPAAGRDLDHVVVVGLDRAPAWVRSDDRTSRVLDDLRAGYEEVAVSGPSGYASVWRLRDTAVE
ncbi:hypothetical protein O2W14_11930 [Modestobacter sp. VKM Ac-2986]|uniref:hypothetical protein n=1 Tax=Modestobacter sp. VKM Ac-2986 TaxID=3004140 RepID=UPI0022AB8AC8|nr:hypothetical protein [Modestobacter sp. VKM Ac-2986]MCZ2829543.1 hypothetical protein [Modestobacter sp. VKM Ac-2986]